MLPSLTKRMMRQGRRKAVAAAVVHAPPRIDGPMLTIVICILSLAGFSIGDGVIVPPSPSPIGKEKQGDSDSLARGQPCLHKLYNIVSCLFSMITTNIRIFIVNVSSMSNRQILKKPVNTVQLLLGGIFKNNLKKRSKFRNDRDNLRYLLSFS